MAAYYNTTRILTMQTRTEKLRSLMADHNLSEDKVAELLGRSVTTVRIWRCKTEASKVIPQPLLELLELKAAQQ